MLVHLNLKSSNRRIEFNKGFLGGSPELLHFIHNLALLAHKGFNHILKRGGISGGCRQRLTSGMNVDNSILEAHNLKFGLFPAVA
ncbi:hypothetical protein Syun_025326 [Stephania yunnanensis]|uniref:Uncharacterized protein n=1 Tax=Stephania yunnanensis TaxID=152371 RepID=A0AAP0HVP6_9MAGN